MHIIIYKLNERKKKIFSSNATVSTSMKGGKENLQVQFIDSLTDINSHPITLKTLIYTNSPLHLFQSDHGWLCHVLQNILKQYLKTSFRQPLIGPPSTNPSFSSLSFNPLHPYLHLSTSKFEVFYSRFNENILTCLQTSLFF